MRTESHLQGLTRQDIKFEYLNNNLINNNLD